MDKTQPEPSAEHRAVMAALSCVEHWATRLTDEGVRVRISPTSRSLWVTLTTGKRLAIMFTEDKPGELTVRALDGPLLVCPQASNTVRLKPI